MSKMRPVSLVAAFVAIGLIGPPLASADGYAAWYCEA
jgi:hypothetical protein